jgi:glycosyltransferase involved in cell wall biosynthesis
MKIWIIQTGEPLHVDGGALRKMRAMNLADFLISRGHEVVIYSTTFNHTLKRQRFVKTSEIKINRQLSYVLIKSPGYKKNISIGRLVDHAILALNFRLYLNRSDIVLPDAAFVGYPPVSLSFISLRWLYKKKVFSILDLKDRWPDIFEAALPIYLRTLSRFVLWPSYFMRNKCLELSSHHTSISKSYIDWMQSKTKIKKQSTVAYLTPNPTLPSDVDIQIAKNWWTQKGIDLGHRKRLVFVGSLSRSFDFSLIKILLDNFRIHSIPIELIICGLGEEEKKLKDSFSGYDNVIFPGWTNKYQSDVIFSYSSYMIAPYRNTADFMDSIPNKIIDSLSRGLPIISTLDGEVKSLIEKNNLGYHLNDESICSVFSEVIKKISNHDDFLRQSGSCLEYFKSNLDYNIVYGNLAEVIENSKN